MVRPPCIDRNGMKKGAWDEEEDNILRAYVEKHGHSNWQQLPSRAGLARCGKSCRLRWVNYLRPGVIRGNFSKEEKDLIIKLHALLGPKWSDIAKVLPGRTDNDIKNYWHAHIQRRSKRSHGVTSSDQIGQEEQSSDKLVTCLTTHNYPQAQTSFSKIYSDLSPDISNALDANIFEQAQRNIWTELYYDQTGFNQILIDLPPFPAEELFDFGEDTIEMVLWS